MPWPSDTSRELESMPTWTPPTLPIVAPSRPNLATTFSAASPRPSKKATALCVTLTSGARALRRRMPRLLMSTLCPDGSDSHSALAASVTCAPAASSQKCWPVAAATAWASVAAELAASISACMRSPPPLTPDPMGDFAVPPTSVTVTSSPSRTATSVGMATVAPAPGSTWLPSSSHSSPSATTSSPMATSTMPSELSPTARAYTVLVASAEPSSARLAPNRALASSKSSISPPRLPMPSPSGRPSSPSCPGRCQPT